MTHLLDGNVLVALAVPTHVHHDAAHRWWATPPDASFATCPITQGTLLRLAVREGTAVQRARQVLDAICSLAGHHFWADEISYGQVQLGGVIGHRQVTDAYLAQLARNHSASLATFDEGLAALHDDVAALVPVR